MKINAVNARIINPNDIVKIMLLKSIALKEFICLI